MGGDHSFKFLDDGLNRELVGLLKSAKLDHSIDEDGVIHYSAADVATIENSLISSIRSQVFPAWQVLACPGDWIARYKDYMSRHDIPFGEELYNGELWFLIPRKHRPLSWKLEGPTERAHPAKRTG